MTSLGTSYSLPSSAPEASGDQVGLNCLISCNITNNNFYNQLLGGQSDIIVGEKEKVSQEGWPLQVCTLEGGSQVKYRTSTCLDLILA